MNCQQSIYLSTCYWIVNRVHTFQRVGIELSPENTPFSVWLNCHPNTHLSTCCYWTVIREHTLQRVIELSPEYTPFSVLLNCHRSTHLSTCCYWTVIREHTFQRVIELSPEYTPFSVLVLNCHQRTHLSACYWTVTGIHTFQRVVIELSSENTFQRVIELSPEYTPFSVLFNCHHSVGVGEWGKQVGSMNVESQVRGCYNISFIYTNQETVSVLEKTQANKTFRTLKQT